MEKFVEKLLDRLKEHHNEVRDMYLKGQGNFSLLDGTMRGIEDANAIIVHFAKEHKGGWIPCSKEFPEDDRKRYIVQKTNGLIDILGFTKDAYKLDKYDFAEYKGKKKQLFYDYDVEYGYIEYECVAWMPLPEKYKGE